MTTENSGYCGFISCDGDPAHRAEDERHEQELQARITALTAELAKEKAEVVALTSNNQHQLDYVVQLETRDMAARHTLSKARHDADTAYTERNKLVALLSRLYPSGIRETAIEGWDPEWNGCVFVDSPKGQLSWHYHRRESFLFEDLPAYEKPWDGHTTNAKYTRLLGLVVDADFKRMNGDKP